VQAWKTKPWPPRQLDRLTRKIHDLWTVLDTLAFTTSNFNDADGGMTRMGFGAVGRFDVHGVFGIGLSTFLTMELRQVKKGLAHRILASLGRREPFYISDIQLGLLSSYYSLKTSHMTSPLR
jgi:hypothetical protein